MLRLFLLLASVFYVSAEISISLSTDDGQRTSIDEYVERFKSRLPADHPVHSRRLHDTVSADVTIEDLGSSTSVDVEMTFQDVDYDFGGTSFDPSVQTVTNCNGVMLIWDITSLTATSAFDITYLQDGFQIEWGLDGLLLCNTYLNPTGTQGGSGSWA